MADLYSNLDAHLAAFWPTRARDEVVWNYGPIWTALPRFRVIRIRPKASSDPLIYITRGAWEVGDEEIRIELLSMVVLLLSGTKADS